jgi:hypothetical protein
MRRRALTAQVERVICERLKIFAATSSTNIGLPKISSNDGGGCMRAMDCSHPAHDDMHFTAATDDELLEQVKAHRDEHHPELSDDQLRETIAQSAYDE